MAVDDHGLEVLKKAGEEVTPGDRSDYYIKVQDIGGAGGGLTDAELRASPVPVSLDAASLAALEDINVTITTPSEFEIKNDAGNPIPISDAGGSITVDGPLTDTELRATAVPVSAASMPLPTGASTAALQTAGNSSLSSIDSDIDVALSTRASQATVASIDSKLNTLGQKVSASSTPVVLASDQSAIPVTDNGGSLTVDGPLTDAQLRATAVPVSGPLTDAQLRATAVPISGTVTANLGTIAGVATETTLSSLNTKVTTTVNGVKVDGSAVTQPVSAASLPLPTGASTSALQTQPGVDIGDVTINNAAGASAVNIQDGGNSITVDGPLTDAQLRATPVPISGSISVTSAKVQTYSASITGLVSVALATDLFTITGSGTKTVTINRILISATKTTSTNIDVLLIKRSTANTGGTSSSPPLVPNDSTNSAATATVLAYTVNPTLGTTVGTVRVSKVFINSVGGGQSDGIDHRFDSEKFQGIVLRGTSQVLAVNLNGVTLAGSLFNICVEWSEE